MSNADKLIAELTDFAEFYRGANTSKELLQRVTERVKHIREEVLPNAEPRDLKYETEPSALPMAVTTLIAITMIAMPFVLKDIEDRENKTNLTIDETMEDLWHMLGKERPRRRAAGT